MGKVIIGMAVVAAGSMLALGIYLNVKKPQSVEISFGRQDDK